MAEGIGLLNQRTIFLYHGFESLFLRFPMKDWEDKSQHKGYNKYKGYAIEGIQSFINMKKNNKALNKHP